MLSDMHSPQRMKSMSRKIFLLCHQQVKIFVVLSELTQKCLIILYLLSTHTAIIMKFSNFGDLRIFSLVSSRSKGIKCCWK